MMSEDDQRQDKVDRFIDDNLKKVFSDLEKDQMPDEIIDLLTVLRAQDAAMKADK